MYMVRNCSLITLVFLHTPVVVAADDIWLAGAEGGKDYSYAYLGYVAPLTLQADAEYFQRYWVDWVAYEYESGNTDVVARAPGAEISIGRRFARDKNYSVAGYIGITYRDTDVDPSYIDVDVKDRQIGGKIQIESDMTGDGYRTEGIATYIAGIDSYWIRGRLYDTPSGARLNGGVEIVVQGDKDYSATQAGFLLTTAWPDHGVIWILKAGLRQVDGQGQYGYFGIESVLSN